MASLDYLKAEYLRLDQSSADTEWSKRWGNTFLQWQNTILPRVNQFLPTDSIMEIGCGRGILSQHLLPYATLLTLVDFIDTRSQGMLPAVTSEPKVNFIVNDGLTFSDIADKSIDFAFSFFSLVDADHTTMQSYIKELDRVLTQSGTAFIHHSNALQKSEEKQNSSLMELVRRVRADDVNAEAIKSICKQHDLEPRIQECVSWIPGYPPVDCFTTLVRPNNIDVNNIGQFTNLDFEDEVSYGISNLQPIYQTSKSKG